MSQVIVEKAPKSDAPDIDKKKFLVPQNITIGTFVYEIRKHMTKLQPEKAIFLFVNDFVPPSCTPSFNPPCGSLPEDSSCLL